MLAVATAFIGLWTLVSAFYTQRRRGLIRTQDKNTYVGTEAKSAGGLCTRGA